jgi:hypothetical protein
MTNNVVPFSPAFAGEVMEQVLLRGDLSQLTHAERVRYLIRVCESLGLNPLTKPFEYLMLNGKLTLYALKGCTDQLRHIHGISIKVVATKEADGLLTVHVHARAAGGREDEDFGVVSLPETMKGDTRANAIMKAITKAKRRVTLSICGLGMLDESELETIPESAKRASPAKPRTVMPAPKTRLLADNTIDKRYEDTIRQELAKDDRFYREPIDELPDHSAPPKLDTSERDGVPGFLDRRKANGVAEASYVDLVEGGGQ